MLHKDKNSKLLAVVLSGCKSNEELSWISHAKIITVWPAKTHTKRKTIPMPLTYSLPITLKKQIFFSNLNETFPHFVLQLSCCS